MPWSFASTSFAFKNIVLKNAHHAGFRPPIKMVWGFHTMPHRFGSQGVVMIYTPSEEKPISLYLGQEIALHKTITVNAGISSRPLMISFGLTFSLPKAGMYTGFVHHPILGWSQGVGMEYVKR
jgi:hypothetical protein